MYRDGAIGRGEGRLMVSIGLEKVNVYHPNGPNLYDSVKEGPPSITGRESTGAVGSRLDHEENWTEAAVKRGGG